LDTFKVLEIQLTLIDIKESLLGTVTENIFSNEETNKLVWIWKKIELYEEKRN
jgi:hypothetical protein